MSDERLDKLQQLETLLTQLKEQRVRLSERLILYRQQRDTCLKELEDNGISGVDIKRKLNELSESIDKELKEIEDKIPHNLEDLLKDDSTEGDKEV